MRAPPCGQALREPLLGPSAPAASGPHAGWVSLVEDCRRMCSRKQESAALRRQESQARQPAAVRPFLAVT